MRVLFLTSTLPRFTGDMQANFVGEQAAAWKAARPEDELFILAPHDKSAALDEIWDGIKIVRFRYMRPARWQALAYTAILPNLKRRPSLAVQVLPFLLAEYLAARRLVAEHKIDLIYAHWVMPQALVALWISQTRGTPFVIQNHSSDLRIFAKFGAAGNALARRVIRAARQLFCVNSAQRDYALGLFEDRERSTIADKTKVLPMGVAPPQAESPVAARYDFGAISRLSKKKGLHHFIAAAEALASRGVRPAIGIAGGGEDAEELKALVNKSDIEFPGFLTGAEKDLFFDMTRIFVMPSVTSGGDVEGMPVALLEALCRGKPTIASRDTNITSLPEWPAIEQDVFYIDDPSNIGALAETMERAATSAEADAPRAERLRSTMSRYWWPNLIEEYLEAIESRAQETA
jgi:glycosyltransferase involved in cell wall biosynthesis